MLHVLKHWFNNLNSTNFLTWQTLRISMVILQIQVEKHLIGFRIKESFNLEVNHYSNILTGKVHFFNKTKHILPFSHQKLTLHSCDAQILECPQSDGIIRKSETLSNHSLLYRAYCLHCNNSSLN